MSNNSQLLKLHLGCGKKYIPGFLHVDVINDAHIHYNGSVCNLPYEDNSASLIYASHVLEHFGRSNVTDVLLEWYRVLAPGGVLRLSVPDFAACAMLYLEEGLQDGLTGLIGLVCGGQRNKYDFHKMIFDEPFLSKLLLSVGFKEVRRWDWRLTEHAEIDDYSQAYLPHMDKENGCLMSLNLESVK